jgi:hypothetical protein
MMKCPCSRSIPSECGKKIAVVRGLVYLSSFDGKAFFTNSEIEKNIASEDNSVLRPENIAASS